MERTHGGEKGCWRRLGCTAMGIPPSRVTHGRAARLLIASVACALPLLAVAPGAGAAAFERRPVLFVHGFESAGSNFASQAMRFESNGYTPIWVMELDYNST